MSPRGGQGPKREPGPRSRRKRLKRETKAKLRAEGRDQDPLAIKARSSALGRFVAEGFPSYLEHLTGKNPDWISAGLLNRTREAFGLLREKLEEASGDVTWDEPFLELCFPVSIDPARGPVPVADPFPFSEEDFTDESWARFRKAAREGKPQEDPLFWKAIEAIEDFTQGVLELQAFKALTGGTALVKEGEEYTPILLKDPADELPEDPEERQAAVDALLEERLRPFVLSAPHAPEEDGACLSWNGERDGKPFVCSLVAELHPLVLDSDTRKAFYPLLAGLVFEGEENPSAWSPEDRGEFWAALFNALDELGERFREGKQTEEETTSETGTIVLTPTVEKPPAERRYLRSGSSLLDRRAAAVLSHTAGLSGLPRTWKSVQRWEYLVQEEMKRLEEELGEAAFEDLRRTTGDSNARGHLLKRGYKAKTKEAVLTLTAEAEDALLESMGPKWFRRVRQDPDGMAREYLEKRLRAGSGSITARFSWYGHAWPLVEEARKSEKETLQDFAVRIRQRSLFEDLSEEDQAALDSRLRLMESIRDGHEVMESILLAFGRTGENPLPVPAWNFYTLLECEQDPHRFRRVRGCLRALQEIRFEVGLPTGATISGAFLSEVAYIARGPGGHGDGLFLLTISSAFVGSLEVFRTSHYRVRNARKVLAYDWTRKLSTDDRKELGRRGGFIRGFTLAPYWDRARDFSYSQKNRRRWIEDNLTRNKDAAKVGRRSVRVKTQDPTANEPRLYGRDFCPLLTESRLYFGALGHFTKNPECGRSLYGRQRSSTKTGGPHSEGLLSVMNYPLPRGGARRGRAEIYRKALEDIRDVVEGAFQGVAAARSKDGAWLTLEEASRLSETALKGVSWFLFIPPDFQERKGSEIEDYHARRYARGEVPYEARVTSDPSVPEVVRPGETIGSGTLPLHERLYVARKQRGLSQAEVADLFGVSQKTVSRWELGPEPDEDGAVRGKPISQELAPLVVRWVETGEAPERS